jgi:hypothetical protein
MLYPRNHQSGNLRAIESCVCSIRSIERNMMAFLRTVCNTLGGGKTGYWKISPAAAWPGRSSIISGELKAGGDSICLCLTGVLLWPPRRPPCPGQHAYTFVIRILSTYLTSVSIFSAVTLGYLSQCVHPTCQGTFAANTNFVTVYTVHEGEKENQRLYNYIYVDSKSFVNVPLKPDGSILCTFLPPSSKVQFRKKWSPICSVKRENQFLSKVRDMAVYMIDL